MKIYLVGGAVRDKLLGLPVKERDWVVVGATIEEMLQRGYKQVGKEFPVFLHPQSFEEYALARTERKIDLGYKGFSFTTTPTVSLEEDLERRDLTINALALDPDTQQIIDPYGGQKDIKNRVLRHVSPAFIEDPVRILRVGRFLARYTYLGFKVSAETIQLMQQMVTQGEVDALVAERVWKELERALGEKNPEQFFNLLAECGALSILFSQLDCQGAGMEALKAASLLSENSKVRFAALFHTQPPDVIRAICKRYRLPKAYQELGILTARYYKAALNAAGATADQLFSLLSSVDIFRREDRFQVFLLACEAIAKSQGIKFDRQWVRECAEISKSVDVQTLLAQGFKGTQLANQLQEKRKQKIAQWLTAQK